MFRRKFFIKSTLGSAGVCLPSLPLRTESLWSDMYLTYSVFSAIISNLGPHKGCGLNGISVIDPTKYVPDLAPAFSKLQGAANRTDVFMSNSQF